ncbi:aminodeoxychorismate synthase component I [Cryobacterium sp. MLB-32]|uniref:aminodeoxychorismate synthase component I n=1 Tax=Cryobacterium sp. MLB-32 TaxID=1529318 RepID=UPI00068B6D98|nr:aminodeoxychorismate synthase component I [Cryobacterium sp. MLB-32]
MTGQIQSIPLPEWWDPERVFQTLYSDHPYSFWLDAGANAVSGRSYLGVATEHSRFVTASVADGTVHVVTPGAPGVEGVTMRTTIFDFLRSDLAGTARPRATSPGVDDPASGGDDIFDGSFRLGWVGWLGYELGSQTVGSPVHSAGHPDAALLMVDRAIMFDHGTRTVTLLARFGAEQPIQDWATEVEFALQTTPERPPAGPPASAVARWRHSPERYAELIAECLVAIRSGDVYQVCLTNEIRVDGAVDPVAAYLRLRESSPSHHGGLLRFGQTALLSASPEQFLQVTPHGEVRTKPIKGTRPRSVDAVRDGDLARELRSSEKERAENLMIVDLMRNDLGRIAELGSVAVSKLLAVESYRHVHQLVSTIEARLAAGVTGVDVVAACFPAGSMTGAPKHSAMGIIDRLEGGPRGLYAGAFGYFGLDGAVDLAIIIRSIVLSPAGASIGTGGGITALSDAREEIEETRIKAAALLLALGAAPVSPDRGSATGKRGE